MVGLAVDHVVGLAADRADVVGLAADHADVVGLATDRVVGLAADHVAGYAAGLVAARVEVPVASLVGSRGEVRTVEPARLQGATRSVGGGESCGNWVHLRWPGGELSWWRQTWRLLGASCWSHSC